MQIVKKLKKRGTSWCIPIDKGLIDSGALQPDEYYIVTIKRCDVWNKSDIIIYLFLFSYIIMKGDFEGILTTDNTEMHVVQITLHVDSENAKRLIDERAKKGYVELDFMSE